MQTMKFPHDLEIYEPDQIDMTRKIDEDKEVRETLVRSAVFNMLQLKIASLSHTPMAYWQRALHEANALRDGTPHIETMVAILWAFVKYLQEDRRISLEAMHQPGFLEFMRKATGKEDLDLEDLGIE